MSFLSLGLDWARDVHPLTVHAIWTDILGFFGSIGYIFSSALTLIVRDFLSESVFNVQIFTTGCLQICFPRQMSPESKSHGHATEKWVTNQTVVSNATSAGTSVDHRRITETGRSFPAYEPTFAHRQLERMPSLPAMVEEVTRPPESHTTIPMCEFPRMVLEPNRRKVEPEEEFEVPASPLSATGHRLARSLRSLSLKRKS